MKALFSFLVAAVAVTLIGLAPLSAQSCPSHTNSIQAPVCGPVAGTSWAPFPAVTLAADELKSQQDANDAWERERVNRYVDEARKTGHWCNGDLPTEFGVVCWNDTMHSHPRDAIGKPVGASDGGSD